VVKQDDVAEEVLQDAFLKIWDKIQAYNPEKGRLFTWMLNVTRNLAIDRNRSKEINKESKTDSLENFVGNSETSETLEQSTDTIGLPESLIQLPAEQRFVVEHLYLKGFTQSELADEFDIPLGTIKTRLRLAMVQLRSIYDVK
jgi:RNA polymerase sigma-70 factor (ECF subfamily)